MFPFLALSVISLLLAPSTQGPVRRTKTKDIREQVDGVIAEWLQGTDRRADALTKALVALGKKAAPYVCTLLDTDRGGAPAEPLVQAVGQLGHPRAPATLGRLLSSEVLSERRAAVDALGALKLRSACPYLVDAMGDADPSLAQRAESILLAKECPSAWVAYAAEVRLPRARDKSRLALLLGRKGGEETHRVLMGLAEDWQADAQLAGLQGLYLAGRSEDGETVALLLADGGSLAVRKQACLVLGKIRYGKATRSLIDVLYQVDDGLVANAHWALQRITGLKLKADPKLWEQWWKRTGKGSS